MAALVILVAIWAFAWGAYAGVYWERDRWEEREHQRWMTQRVRERL